MEKNKERTESRPMNVAADAAVVIMMEKLRNLRRSQEACSQLKRQVDGVISKLQLLYGFLKDECRRESHPEWIDRLLRALYEAEDMIDIFIFRLVLRDQETIRIVPDVLMNLTLKCLLYRQMGSFIKEIDGLLQDQHLHHQDTSKPDHPDEGRQYYEWWQRVNAEREYQADINAYRKDAYDEVKKRLLGDGTDLHATAIYGQEGSGKTYLARGILNLPDIKHHFECRAWVHASDDLTLTDIRYAVLKQVKASDKVLKNRELMLSDEVKEALPEELGKKRYLIVLDDFYSTETWYEFITYLPDWSNGSRVLVTTRNRYTAHVVDNKIPFELKNIGEPDKSEQLEKEGSPEISSLQNKDILCQFFQVHNGSPLLIGLLKGLLLKCSSEELMPEIENASLPEILTLSYNHLPREEKPCFLYLTLFPKAMLIPVRRILRLWLAEGLLMSPFTSPEDRRVSMSLEDRGVMYLEDLIMRNFVEVVSWMPDGTPATCQVGTSMYDMFRPQAIGLGLLHIHCRKPKESEPSKMEPGGIKGQQWKVRWLTEHANIKSFSTSDPHLVRNVRSFISFCTRKGTLTKDLGNFLHIVTSHNNYRLLRVLDLEGVYKPNLHGTIGRLVLLKYLGLRSTVLDRLPDPVGDLPGLETLDIKNTNITILPDSLWKSDCLRHLYLSGFHVDPSIIRRYVRSGFLSNLRTMSGLYIGNISESLVSCLSTTVTNLTKLKIYYQSSDKPGDIARWLSKLTNLQSLKLGIVEKDRALCLPDLTYLPEHHHLFNLYLLGKLPNLEVSQLPSCLRFLTLSKSGLSIDPMHSLGQLPNLRTLRLLANSYTGQIMCCSTNGFPSLRFLKIWSLPNLQRLNVELNCMVKLKELELRDCPKLERPINLERLISLEELILTKMPKKFLPDEKKCKLPRTRFMFEIDPCEVWDSAFPLVLPTDQVFFPKSGAQVKINSNF